MSYQGQNAEDLDIVREIRKMDSKLKNLEKAVSKRTTNNGVKKFIRTKRRQTASSHLRSKKNKEEENLSDQLRQLKDENKSLKDHLNHLMNTRRSVGGEDQLNRLENDVHDLRKKYDEYRHDVRVLKQKIVQKEKELHFLRTQYRSETATYQNIGLIRPRTAPTRPSTSYGRMSPSARSHGKPRSPSARSVASSTMSFRDAGMFSTSSSRSGGYAIEQKRKQIQKLEKKLDRYIIKYNESQQVKERNQKILKSLQRERNGYDNQIKSIEKTLSNKKNDYRKLISLFRQATYLKEQSKTGLKDAESELLEIKKQKNKEFEEKRKDVKNRVRLTKKLFSREVIRKQSKTGMIQEDVDMMERAQVLQQFGNLKSESNIKKGQGSLYSLESTWRKIKEVTGRANPKAVVEKFYGSKDTLKNLQNITRTSQKNIEKLKLRRNALKEKLETLKYSQSSTGAGTKRMLDEFIQQLSESRTVLSKNKKEYERLRNIVIQVKCGLQHLCQKLGEVFDDDLAPPATVKNFDHEAKGIPEREFVMNLVDAVKDILTEKLQARKLVQEMNQKEKEKLKTSDKSPLRLREGGGVGILKEEEYLDLEKLYSTSEDNVRLKSLKGESLEKKLMKKRITGILQRLSERAKLNAEKREDGYDSDELDEEEEEDDLLKLKIGEKDAETGLETPMTPFEGDEEEEGEDDEDDDAMYDDHMIDILDRETVKKLAALAFQKHKRKTKKTKDKRAGSRRFSV